MTLIVLAIAWLVGIYLGDALRPPAWVPPAAALAFAPLSLLLHNLPRARLALLVLVALALGAWRLEAAQIPLTPASVRQHNGAGELTLVGVVVEDPQRRADGQRLVLAAERVELEGQVLRAEGLVLVRLPAYPERRYGERLALTGELKTPREADRPGGFDYRQYLARQGIFSLMEPERARVISDGHGNPVLAALTDVRVQARLTLMRSLPEPQASLAVGILLGIQSSIPEDVSNDFSITGTSHILVISGWNITIIATALAAIADRMRLSKGIAFWTTVGTIWLYALFVGASATVLRAALMGTVVVIGQRLERPAHAWTTLFAASWLLTLWDPQALWDMGFQLSALATASLFAYGKGTEALLLRTPLRHDWLGWAREALTATLAAQILALPLILFAFGNFSIVAPLANVVLVPVVPYAMLFGAISLVGGMLWLPLGQWLALPAYLFLAWLTEGARFFAQLPYASVQIPPFSLWVLLGYYAIVLGAWLWNVTLVDTCDGEQPPIAATARTGVAHELS
jgi:competence protein ComEC